MNLKRQGPKLFRYLVCGNDGCRRPDGKRVRCRYEWALAAAEVLLKSELPSARRGLASARGRAARWANAFERGELDAPGLRERWAGVEARVAEALRVKSRLAEAGLEVTVYPEGAAASLMWPGG